MKKAIIFIVSLLLIIAIGLVFAYMLRAPLLQSAGPLIADRLGVEIAELDIEELNLRQIIVPKFKARYYDQGRIIDVSIDRLIMQIDPWAGIRDAIKSVEIAGLELSVDAQDELSNSSDSDLRAIELVSFIPATMFSVEHLALAYQFGADKTLYYIGNVKRDQSSVMAAGLLSAPGNSKADIKLKINQNKYFDLSVASLLAKSDSLQLQGEFNIEDDWLLLDASGEINVSELGRYLANFDTKLPIDIKRADSQFKIKLEADLGLNVSDIAQSIAMELELETSAQAAMDDYDLHQVDLDARVSCIVSAVRVADCIVKQPVRTQFEFSNSPAWLHEYFGWREKKYIAEIYPSDEIALRVVFDEALKFKVHGDMQVNMRAQNAPLIVDAKVSDLAGNSIGQSWRLNGKYNAKLETKDIVLPVVASRAIASIQGEIEATDALFDVQIFKGTRFVAQQLRSSDFVANKVELTQQNNASIRYENKIERLQGDDIRYSFRPIELQGSGLNFAVDQGRILIRQLRQSKQQWRVQATVESDRFDLKKENIAVEFFDIQSNLALDQDQIRIHGNVGLGQKKSPLQFVGEHNLNTSIGNISVALAVLPLARNELITQLIAGTGLPMQFKAGNVGIDIAANWDESSLQYPDAKIDIRLKDVAGDYAQNQFVGLNTVLALAGSRDWYLAKPLAVHIENINAGVPITDISFGFDRVEKADNKQPVVRLSELSAQVLDGSIYAQDIEIDLNQPVNEFSIYLSNLSLEKLLALNQTEDLIASGSFNGELPIRIDSDNFSIQAGWLKADENGGVIKYNRVEEILVGNANLELVADLLKDFRYNEMSAQVDLHPDGNVLLSTKLHGRSPNSEFDKQVNLNFNIEFNLWKFLESARLLTRIDQDIGKQIISKQRDN